MKAIKDGSHIAIVKDDFVDLQNSDAVFVPETGGDLEALNKLFDEERNSRHDHRKPEECAHLDPMSFIILPLPAVCCGSTYLKADEHGIYLCLCGKTKKQYQSSYTGNAFEDQY